MILQESQKATNGGSKPDNTGQRFATPYTIRRANARADKKGRASLYLTLLVVPFPIYARLLRIGKKMQQLYSL
jgi:hypothetical protein